MIPNSLATERLRDAINLPAIIGEYVRLRPAGTDSLKGLCPFHNERTPSFVVRPSKNVYHCFSCNAGGDAFTFIRALEGVSFMQARQILADRFGVVINDERLTKEQLRELRREREQRARTLADARIWQRLVCARLTSEMITYRELDKRACAWALANWDRPDYEETIGYRQTQIVWGVLGDTAERLEAEFNLMRGASDAALIEAYQGVQERCRRPVTKEKRRWKAIEDLFAGLAAEAIVLEQRERGMVA